MEAAQQPQISRGSLADADTSVRLLVRHLPTFLSETAISELFQHYGADAFQYFESGKMAGAAFLSFRQPETGVNAFHRMSSLELFGKKLRVEYVRRPKRKEFKKRPPFPGIAPELGIDYPSDPTLEYTYPEATPMIVSNISQALLRVPRFYTQVLHLMNKMNLPPPFGPPASYNPQQLKTKRKKPQAQSGSTAPTTTPAAAHVTSQAAVQPTDDLSSSESELESDHEVDQKRLRSTLSSADFEKELRAAKAQVIRGSLQEPTSSQPRPPPSPIAPPSALHPPALISPHAYPLPPSQLRPPSQFASPTPRSYLSNSELQLRVPLEELRATYKWTETPPFPKLYVKNLPQDVTAKDVEYLFGRYFASDQEARSQLDIKVMDGKMKGSAFVGFPSVGLAQQAQTELNGVLFRGQPLVILFGKK